MFCYTHIKKRFEGQWPDYNWSKYSGAMERPIKVNRHKGGRVDIYFRSSVGSNILGGLGSNPVRAWIFLSLPFLQLVKLQLTCKDHVFLLFYIGSSKKINFLQIHSLNLRKEENLCFDNILFVNDWNVINKISPVWPNHVFSKWKGRGVNVYFEQSLYEKKSELIIFSW